MASRKREERRKRAREQAEAVVDHIAPKPKASWSAAVVLGMSALIAVPIALAWSGVTGVVLETDPWLGLHARAFCSSVCDGGRGPYVIESYRSGKTTRIDAYCRAPSSTSGAGSGSAAVAVARDERCKLPRAGSLFLVSAWPIAFLAVWPIVQWRVSAKRADPSSERE